MIILRPRWLLTIGDTDYKVGSVSGTKDVGSLADVVDIEIVDTLNVTIAPGATVSLDYGDRDALLRYPVLRGEVQEYTGVAEASKTMIRCNGNLSKLRDTWDADTEFEDPDTPTTVVEAALTGSGITFDVDNIQTIDYPLSAHEPVVGTKWERRDRIISELNDVFEMCLCETGGEVEWFHFTRVPDGDDAVMSYENGVNAEFLNDTMRRGPIDDIINRWGCKGVDYACGPILNEGDEPSCRCTPWANAQATNSVLGSGVRADPGTVQSNVIQDPGLCAWIVAERMHETNRLQRHLSIETFFDPTMRLADVVTVVDTNPGVRMTLTHACLVERIEIQDDLMTLSVVCDEAGEEGSIDQGIEKRCNKNTSNSGSGSFDLGPWPRIFVNPGPWVPQDCNPFEEITDCTDVEWAEDIGPVAGDAQDWEITGRVTLQTNTDMLTMGVRNGSGEYKIVLAGRAWTGWAGDPKAFYIATPSTVVTHNTEPGTANPLYMPSDGVEYIDWRLRWTSTTKTLTGVVGSLEACITDDAIENPSTFDGDAVTFEETHGSPDRSSEAISYNCSGVGSIDGWVVARGIWSFDLPTGLEADEETAGGVIYM